ncbi:energy transducer TonB [Fodinibius salsisoli]|uniref:Energy transducer TonB n=1 Tax=Fodinibius salsisoli TaxID=2820877 RepID=A0ABT3PHJ9_9BACT|nr:energy transducer TonB [Fodinibius salsisoli]MCW9705387.1 energy transducer TonB [Fodinibius salsisoli]
MKDQYTKKDKYVKIIGLLAAGIFCSVLLSSTALAQESKPKVYTVVDQMPEIKGGLSALYKEITYPEEARRKNISGRVYLQVIVNKDGTTENPKVLKGIGGGCGEAAKKAIKEIQFKPGKNKGKAVRVKYSLPVIFRLEK